MSVQHWKNVPVPEAGDDLLEAFPDALDAAGIIRAASSPAAARVIVQQAITAGHGPSPDHPAYFDIHKIVWTADGTTDTSGALSLVPVNQVESAGVAYTAGETRTLSNGQEWVIATSGLAVADYPRLVDAWAVLYATPTAGSIDLEARIMGVGGQPGHWKQTTGADTVVSSQRLTVPAGADPQVQLVVIGRTQPATITLGTAGRLQVTAWPIAG